MDTQPEPPFYTFRLLSERFFGECMNVRTPYYGGQQLPTVGDKWFFRARIRTAGGGGVVDIRSFVLQLIISTLLFE